MKGKIIKILVTLAGSELEEFHEGIDLVVAVECLVVDCDRASLDVTRVFDFVVIEVNLHANILFDDDVVQLVERELIDFSVPSDRRSAEAVFLCKRWHLAANDLGVDLVALHRSLDVAVVKKFDGVVWSVLDDTRAVENCVEGEELK